MSLVLTIYTREGIVMAADSRLTLNFTRQVQGQPDQLVSVTASDSARKLFLTANGVGISTFGEAMVAGGPIAGAIESFMVSSLAPGLPPRETADALLAHFVGLGVIQATRFHVAGYRPAADGSFAQEAYFVDLQAATVSPMDQFLNQGCNWAGDSHILQRLLNDVSVVNNGIPAALPNFGIPWGFFTLQDGIDFANFAIQVTIDTMRFQAREKTVGGPVDVIVIRPGASEWIAQKRLGTKHLG